MTLLQEASAIKQRNLIDMAITFTAMNRMFEGGAKPKIAGQLARILPALSGIRDRGAFEESHDQFCRWFMQNIRTAERVLKNGAGKSSQSASYGHAAKVFDIIAKVFVYYCRLPSSEAAVRVEQFLHAAIDTPILRELMGKYPGAAVAAETVEQIDRSQYRRLQDLARRHIEEEFLGAILPVQYDDIMWRRLNREG